MPEIGCAEWLKQIRLDLGEDDLKLTDILTPENFDLLVNAAFDLGKLSCSTQEATPHSTKRIKEDLMKASELKQTLSETNSTDEIDAQKLLQVCL